jgi:hypothetical protein
MRYKITPILSFLDGKPVIKVTKEQFIHLVNGSDLLAFIELSSEEPKPSIGNFFYAVCNRYNALELALMNYEEEENVKVKRVTKRRIKCRFQWTLTYLSQKNIDNAEVRNANNS